MRKSLLLFIAAVSLPAAAYAQAAGPDIDSKDSLGRTPLSYALATGQSPEAIQMLLKDGAARAKREYDNAPPPLFGEAANGEGVPAPSLDAAGLNAPDRMGRTPLGYATATGQSPEVIRALIQAGADPSARSPF